MDALTLLTADHNRVRGLFTMFKEAEEKGDTATMTTVAKRIFRELEVHASIEESDFYPTVREKDEIADLVAEGIEEHNVVKTLLGELQSLEPDETWTAKMKVLIENVEHHAEEEEKEMFPKVRSAMRAELETLAERLEAAKERLGAPTMADKIDLTTTDVERLAKEQQIPGRSKMSKDELLAAVDPTA